jgi:hypothetical protein
VKGDTKRTNDLKAELECNRYTLDTLNPHDLANLLKTWLRELPDPLIPFELQYPSPNLSSRLAMFLPR